MPRTPPELQAGIALGLAQSVAARFPAWGADFAALWAGVVVMNLLTGPPLFKVGALVLDVPVVRSLQLGGANWGLCAGQRPRGG